MSAIGKNLYPPIVPTYQTPFVYSSADCRIFFSFPPYNNKDDFSEEIQVTISTQNDNRSALKKSKYPNGIAGMDYQIDPDIKGDNKYYIKIDNDDIEKGFSPDTYYKVQIRFSKAGFSSKENSYSSSNYRGRNLTQKYLNSNLENFSEWSTITLVKVIYKPSFILRPFSFNDENKNIIFSTGFQTLSGTLTFLQDKIEKSSTEYLKSYRIYIYKIEENGDKILYIDSEEQFPINPNEVYYNIKKRLDNNINYTLSIELYTNNGYVLKQEGYNFTFSKIIEAETNANITVNPDYVNGRAKVTISLDSISVVNNFAIKRSSSKDDFLIWEDVHFCSFYDKQDLTYEWYDYTLESGVLYQYAVQRIDVFNNIRNREKIAIDENNNSTIIMLPFDDIFLSRAGMQFKVKFDPNISSLKTNYSESKIETLGSQYPFIRRNGKAKYKEFPISGLITAFCDEEGLFLNKDNLYKEQERIYYDGQGVGYNISNNISEHKDFVYEKLFRDKIIDFLQEDSIKLFRSETEGNLLIKLMNINFTPNKTLGRMLYSFSATAIEVADCNIENYDKYGIQYLQKENLRKETERISYKLGQINDLEGTKFNWDNNIVKYINDRYSRGLSKESREGKSAIEVSVTKLKWIRLTFNSKPRLICKEWAQVGAPANIFMNTDANNPSVQDNALVNDDAYLGYLIKLNGKRIIVNKNGIYELTGDNINIESLSVPKGFSFTLDYIAEVIEREPNINKPTFLRRVLFNNIGQIHSKFKVGERFIEKIRSKYLIKHPKFTQSFALLDDITIEADSGTIVNIIQKSNSKELDNIITTHEIGKSNILKLKDEYQDGIFLNFYFDGRHLYKKEYNNNNIFLKVMNDNNIIKTIPYKSYDGIKFPYIIKIIDNSNNNIYIAEDEYLDLSDLKIDTNNFKASLNNCVVKTNTGYKIYYENKWYDFNRNTNIVKCPIDALIDYTYTLIKEEY